MEVQHVMGSSNYGTLLKRHPYKHFKDEERAQIRRYTADHGVAAAVRHYKQLFLKRVKESSMRM